MRTTPHTHSALIAAIIHSAIAIFACLALTTPAAAQSGVTVELEQFGVGDRYRPGGYVGAQITLRSALDEAAQVWVQWELPNVDGDIAEYGRSLALGIGEYKSTWLYFPIPPDFDPAALWPVRVFELRDDGRRGAEIGGARLGPTSTSANGLNISEGMIATIGTSYHLGLNTYSQQLPNGRLPAGHELTRQVGGIDPKDLPDRWEGLMAFEAIIWADDNNPNPNDLSIAQADALIEYIRRGGHFIIALGKNAQYWSIGAPSGGHLLEGLMPANAPTLVEGVPLDNLLPVLTKKTEEGLIKRATFDVSMRVFGQYNSGDPVIPDNGYEPLIGLPDGRVIAVQRTLGHGRITIIGFDVSRSQLYSVPFVNGSVGLPQADVFWNRILGRRMDAVTSQTITQLEDARLLSTRNRPIVDMGSGKLFLEQISRSGQAGVGLSLTLLLFAAYWIIAGPGIYYGLKARGLAKHSWLGFAVAAAVFTALAWGASSLRVAPVSVKHVTYLDHIYRPDGDRDPNDPQVQKAVGWFSLMLPSYGSSEVTIDQSEIAGRRSRDLFSIWSPPGASVQGFPNVDRYRVSVGEAPAAFDQSVEASVTDEFALPSRATATYGYANWLGVLDPNWGAMIHEASDEQAKIRLATSVGSSTPDHVAGQLLHGLPGPLTNVKIIFVNNPRYELRFQTRTNEERSWPPPLMSGRMLNQGRMWSLARDWVPETILDLGTETKNPTGTSLLEPNIFKTYVEQMITSSNQLTGAGATSLTPLRTRQFMEMLGIFQQLTPPKYIKPSENQQGEDSVVFTREIGRELDLSAWLTRPCVIITGYLHDTPTPIPVKIDGETPRGTPGSVTLVRWICPLPLDITEALMMRPDAREFDDENGGEDR